MSSRRLLTVMLAAVCGMPLTVGPARATTNPTTVRHVSPVDADGALAAGFSIAHRYSAARCQRPSSLTGMAYRCFTARSPQGVLDPCWVTTNSDTVDCMTLPWRHRVVQLSVTDGYDDADPFTHVSSPWGVRLSSGPRCLFHPASVESAGGHAIRYYCGKHIALVGHFTRGRVWHVHAYRNDTPHSAQPTYRSLGRVPVSTVWFGDPSRTD